MRCKATCCALEHIQAKLQAHRSSVRAMDTFLLFCTTTCWQTFTYSQFRQGYYPSIRGLVLAETIRIKLQNYPLNIIVP
jgi:hypothetical protein